jgi:hypothetical protein
LDKKAKLQDFVIAGRDNIYIYIKYWTKNKTNIGEHEMIRNKVGT